MSVTISYTMATLTGILQYLGPGTANPGSIPPIYNPIYDLNNDGWITIKDLLICLAGM